MAISKYLTSSLRISKKKSEIWLISGIPLKELGIETDGFEWSQRRTRKTVDFYTPYIKLYKLFLGPIAFDICGPAGAGQGIGKCTLECGYFITNELLYVR